MVRPSQFKINRQLKMWAANSVDFCLPILELFRSSDSKLEGKEIRFESKNLAILAAYNEDPKVILSIKRMLAEVGFDCVVIYNCPENSATKDFLVESGFLVRSNVGFDFGAYRDSMQLFGEPTNLILMNTSMFWDLNRLKGIVSNLSQKSPPNSVTYLVESFQGVWHGQSFFIHLKLDSLHLNELKKYLRTNTKNWRFKRSAVKRGEKALFRFFLAQRNMHVDFLYPYESVVSAYLSLGEKTSELSVRNLLLNDVPLNPTQHLWPALSSLNFPGVKKTLVNQNPAGLEKVPSINSY
jgi:hypothetical protein